MEAIATIRTIGHALASTAVRAAVEGAVSRGCPVAAAVFGASNELVSLLRASGTPSPSTQIAQDKAYTAASFRMPTPDLFAMIAGNPALSTGIAVRPGIAMFGGGLPIIIDGEFVGAIGVSGATEELDIECANAGLAAIGAEQF